MHTCTLSRCDFRWQISLTLKGQSESVCWRLKWHVKIRAVTHHCYNTVREYPNPQLTLVDSKITK